MEYNHPIEKLMKNTMENLKGMVDANTVIGDAIQTKDGSCIVPISKVSFGFGSGGSEFPGNRVLEKADERFAFGGGSGAGVSIKPIAFLVLQNNNVRLLPVNQTNTYDRIVDTIPQIIDIFKSSFMDNDNCCDNEKTNNCCSDETEI